MVSKGCTREEAEKICDKLDGSLATIDNYDAMESAKLAMSTKENDVAFHFGLINQVYIINLSIPLNIIICIIYRTSLYKYCHCYS